MPLSTLGTDPDYASLLGQRNDPRLLMAQKLMDMEKLPASNSSKSSFWANLLNQGARGAASGYLYNDVQADREKEAAAQGKEAGVADTQLQDIMKRLGGGSAPVKDGSGGTAPAQPSTSPQPSSAPQAQGDPGDAGASIQDRLRQRESSGNYQVMNKQRFVGAYQFGSNLLRSNGMYQPTEQGEPANTWGGTFSIPGYPGVKTLADFRNTPEAQDAAYKIAMANNDKQLREMGVYDRAAKLGVPRDGLLAGAWLGGVHGVANWVDSGGQSNPDDANGTRIGDYVRLGSGQGGSPTRTRAARAPAMARGWQQADAGPGSNLDALLRGVDQPKPRGIQLAENLLPNGTATDSPTPILPNMAPVSTATAPLPFLTPPAQPDAATTPPIAAAVPPRRNPAVIPPPPEPAPPPQPPVLPVPGVPPGVPPAPSNMPTFDDPLGLATAQPPPLPPAPLVGTGSGPEAGPTDPNAPLPLLTPPSQAPMVAPPGSGETGGQPTIPPQPQAPTAAPAGSGETGGQPTVLPQEEPPLPVPPIPPALLARRLQQAAPAPPAGGGDNATEALNAASLAAARRGETFVPGAGPTGQQLAAALLPPGAASPATPDDAAMYAAGYGPAGGGAPGDQGGPGAASQQGGPVPLLQPLHELVTPASGPGDATGAPGATTDPSAAGGPGKGAAPAPARLPGGLPDQATVTEALTMAAQWKASPNPRVRERGIVLDTAATMAQRRLDHAQTLEERRADQDFTHRENAETRRQATELALANRTPAERPFFDPAKNEYRYEERDPVTHEWKDTGRIVRPGQDNSAAYPDAKVVGSVGNNMQTLRQIDDAIAATKANPNAFGLTQKYVPEADRLGTPQEQAARARVSRLANREIHTLSGQAVGVQEDKRMQGELPYVGHSQSQILSKLGVMREMAVEQLKQAYDFYGKDAGFRAIPGHARALGFDEGPLPSDQVKGGLGSGAAQAAPGGGTPLPADKGQLQNGTVYTLRDGRRGKWNGTSFEVQ